MPEVSWSFPYASQRMPVMARNVVATSQPLAALAGTRMLLKGGNAVDAALATAMALPVVEPTMNGIGSDAFCILWDGEQIHGLNASGRSPKAWSPEMFPKDGVMPQRGWDAVTVPGCVSAWVALSDRFGKLPFVTEEKWALLLACLPRMNIGRAERLSLSGANLLRIHNHWFAGTWYSNRGPRLSIHLDVLSLQRPPALLSDSGGTSD